MIHQNLEVLLFKLNKYQFRALLSFLLLGILILNFNSASCQTLVELSEIVIEAEDDKNASREEKKEIQDLKILTRKDIRHVGSKGVGEILKRLPGIVVQGPPMAYRNVKVNGLDKEYQTILLDGHRPAGGEDRREFKLDRLPSSLIEGVEILYNPTVKYGGSSPSGIINIKTRDVPRKREIGLDLGLDRSNTIKGLYPEGSFYIGDSKKKFAYLFYAGRYNYRRMDNSLLSDQESGISGMKEEISSVSLNTASARLKYQINQNNVLRFKVLWSSQDQFEDIQSDVNRRSQGGLNYKQDTSSEISYRKLFMSELKYESTFKTWKGSSSLKWDWSGMDKNKDRIREKDPDWERSYETEQQILKLVDFRSDWSRNRFTTKGLTHDISSGVETSFNKRDFNRFAFSKIATHKYWDESEDGSYLLNEGLFASYLSDEVSYKGQTITPGMRIEHHSRTFTTDTASGYDNYWALLPALHGRHPNEDQNLIFRWGISRQNALQPFLYMVPVLKVKHKKEIIERGNPNLLPAKSWNYNASLTRYFGKRSKVNLRALFTDIRDVVELKFLGLDEKFNYRMYQPMNVDVARIYGANIDVLIDMRDFSEMHFRIWGNYSWNDSRVRDPGTNELRSLNEQPHHIANVNADYLATELNLRIAIGYTWVGERRAYETIDPTGTYIPGYYYSPFGQLDCSFKYYVSRWGYFSMSFHNLLNQTEVLHQNKLVEELIPGRLIRLGFSLVI